MLASEVVWAGVSIFGIYITAGWSNDTAIMFKAVKFYIAIIIVSILCAILKIFLKKKILVNIENLINSILFIRAELVLSMNLLLVRTDYCMLFAVIPAAFGVLGISNDR